MFARTRRGRARFMTREKPRYLEEILAAWNLVTYESRLAGMRPCGCLIGPVQKSPH